MCVRGSTTDSANTYFRLPIKFRSDDGGVIQDDDDDEELTGVGLIDCRFVGRPFERDRWLGSTLGHTWLMLLETFMSSMRSVSPLAADIWASFLASGVGRRQSVEHTSQSGRFRHVRHGNEGTVAATPEHGQGSTERCWLQESCIIGATKRRSAVCATNFVLLYDKAGTNDRLFGRRSLAYRFRSRTTVVSLDGGIGH